MSDRVNGFVVILDKNYKDDDVKDIMNAIKQIKGVVAVNPNVVDASDYIVPMRTRIEVANMLYDFIEKLLNEE